MDRRKFLETLSLPAISLIPFSQWPAKAGVVAEGQRARTTRKERQVAIAFETTEPTSADRHPIVVIAAVEIVEQELSGAIYHRHLNPACDFDPDVLLTRGLTRATLNEMPSFGDIAVELAGYLDGAALIFHGAPLYLFLLRREFLISGHKFPATRAVFDTCELAKKIEITNEMLAYAFDPRVFDGADGSGAFRVAMFVARIYLAMTNRRAK